MRTRWLGAALAAWCLMGSVAHAQWGLNGQEVDPRLMAESDDPPEGRPGIQINAEYLLWWFKDPHLSQPAATTGALGAAGTTVLIGPDSLNYPDPFSGARITARFWCDTTSTGSLEVSGLILGRRSNTVVANPATGPAVFVPVLTPAGEAAVAAPGGVSAASTSLLWGAEANLVGTPCNWLDIIVGFRYLALDEALERTAGIAAGTAIDHIGTQDQFIGGQVGARVNYTCGSFSAGASAKLALGDIRETVLTHGQTNMPGAITPVGLLIGAGTTGRFERDKFGVVPEFSARVGYLLAGNVQLFAAYNFLLFDQVIRPGDQIDRRTVVPAGSPYPPFAQTSFWAQGFDFGIDIRY